MPNITRPADAFEATAEALNIALGGMYEFDLERVAWSADDPHTAADTLAAVARRGGLAWGKHAAAVAALDAGNTPAVGAANRAAYAFEAVADKADAFTRGKVAVVDLECAYGLALACDAAARRAIHAPRRSAKARGLVRRHPGDD